VLTKVQRVQLGNGQRTTTVLGADHLPIPPVEEYLEYLRVQSCSPNTVKSYARALALWFDFLLICRRRWDQVGVDDFGAFLNWLRTGDSPQVISISPGEPRFSEATVSVRLRAVISFYRYHQLNGVQTPATNFERSRWGGNYKPMLEHIVRRNGGARRGVIRVRRPKAGQPPTLTPQHMELINDACATWDGQERCWKGSLRDRLLWTLLAETGLRLGEALSLQHRDWHTGRGDTPFLEVVPRDHPHGIRAKGGAYRKLYISDQLDRLYGEYLWLLCEAGADLAVADLDAAYVFVNLSRQPLFAPMRPETVYELVRRLKRQLAGRVPATWTPHWFRHTHATALLLSGTPVHVVSRRLGHRDVQTTLNTYAWVTEDAELRAVADWKELTATWRVLHES